LNPRVILEAQTGDAPWRQVAAVDRDSLPGSVNVDGQTLAFGWIWGRAGVWETLADDGGKDQRAVLMSMRGPALSDLSEPFEKSWHHARLGRVVRVRITLEGGTREEWQ